LSADWMISVFLDCPILSAAGLPAEGDMYAAG
jgi:hypothetical protein